MQANNMSRQALRSALLSCCASNKWVRRMLEKHPFKDADALFHAADSSWLNLDEVDYLEAFAGHPKIGNLDGLDAGNRSTRGLAANEQSGVDTAETSTLLALARGNVAYEDKFGFIFIICATGKSGSHMLRSLTSRLALDRDTELKNAIEQQRRIFHIRLENLL